MIRGGGGGLPGASPPAIGAVVAGEPAAGDEGAVHQNPLPGTLCSLKRVVMIVFDGDELPTNASHGTAWVSLT